MKTSSLLRAGALACCLVPTAAFAFDGTDAGGVAAENWLTYAVMALVNVVAIGGILLVGVRLVASGNWSVADAVSEEADEPVDAGTDQSGNKKPAKKMVASSSRLIALLGMIATLGMFVGVGNYVIWRLFKTGTMPEEMTSVMAFLFGGSSLFVPYALNQFRSAFESFGGKK